MQNYEAFSLAVKRVKARITRAKELGIGEKSSNELVKLAHDLAEAKAIEEGGKIKEYLPGQEYYVQLLLNSLNEDIDSLVQEEYENALLELGDKEEALAMLKNLRDS